MFFYSVGPFWTYCPSEKNENLAEGDAVKQVCFPEKFLTQSVSHSNNDSMMHALVNRIITTLKKSANAHFMNSMLNTTLSFFLNRYCLKLLHKFKTYCLLYVSEIIHCSRKSFA